MIVTDDMEFNIRIIKSRRKSIGIEIKPDLTVLVRAPLFLSDNTIKKLVSQKNDWIEKKINQIKEKETLNLPIFSKKEIEILREKTRVLITPKAEYYAKILGVSFNKLSVKKQRSVWGSCSAKRNINFNLLLSLCPEDVINYIVVHELCHLKQLNHSIRFWAEVEKLLPDYRSARLWLKHNGSALIKRLPK